MPINLNLLSCPKCGGKLKETNEGKYLCSFCERVWEKEIDDTFDKVLSGVTEALSAERAADIARLKRALYEETHKKYISNKNVEKLCRDIINHYDDEDFYARFYLAACDDSRIAFSSFCEETDIASRKEDVPEILDYLITGLREEWITNVSEIIEKAYKNTDTSLYSKYRTKFEEMAERINEGIYEPTLHRDVFVMYSGKDMDKVLKMVSMLENDYGLSCFVAAKNLKHGAGSTDRYKDAIHEAIKNCDVYLLISSGNSRSRQCEVYEEVMYIMDNFPTHPRVEYLAENYKGYGIEKKFREFFSGLEWCISYEDTAERIAGYCDDIQRGVISLEGSYVTVASPKEETVTEPAPAKSTAIDALLVKAKRMLILEKYKEAFAEYERLADENPDDIRPYIGMVAAVSENYTKTNCPDAELHIKVINNFFGNDAGTKEDKDYAAYLTKLKAAAEKRSEEEAESIRRKNEEAARAKRLEEERVKREKEEAARAKRLEEERAKREKEEAARKAAEEAARISEAARRLSYKREGKEIYFGSWPSTKVTSTVLSTALSAKAGVLPLTGSSAGWTSYKYYIESRNSSDYMWYKDIEYNGAKYRGVYFLKYRPFWTDEKSNTEQSYQDDHGYKTGTVYWFKWEPVKWRILKEEGGKALIFSDLIIDSQDFFHDRDMRKLNGKSIYPNNYEHSDIRRWLNNTFLESAFTNIQKNIIFQTTVDNSAKTTESVSNKFVCADTLDSVFLLSYADEANAAYGFQSISACLKRSSDYAKCQGTFMSDGSGWWWLRSPNSDFDRGARGVYSDGKINSIGVNRASGGVCPAMWISL